MPASQLCYYNNGVSFRHVEPDYTVKAGEVLFAATPSATQLAAAFPGFTAASTAESNINSNAPIQAQIRKLEASQSRMLREHALGDTSAASRLQSLETQIATLRSKLK